MTEAGLRAHVRIKHPFTYYMPRLGYISVLVTVVLVSGY